VDRVLHNRGRVSPETAMRIRQVIEELGFTPNLFARNLSTSKEYRFGVIMPGLRQDSGYWRMPWRGMEMAVENHRAYRLSLQAAFYDRYKPESFLAAHRDLVDAKVDGIIMAPVIPQAALHVLGQPGLPPHVCFDTGLDHPGILCQIGQDSERSGRLAARLMELLCPSGAKVGIIQPDTDNAHTGLRVSGFCQGLPAGRFRFITRRRSQHSESAAVESILDEFLAGPEPVGAVMVAESTTHLVANSLAARGRHDLPLIGYDLMLEDIPGLESGVIDFLITQNPVGQGESAVQVLFESVVLNRPVDALQRIPIDIVTRENYPELLPSG
jgi:LacI family transcriptional regulator